MSEPEPIPVVKVVNQIGILHIAVGVALGIIVAALALLLIGSSFITL